MDNPFASIRPINHAENALLAMQSGYGMGRQMRDDRRAEQARAAAGSILSGQAPNALAAFAPQSAADPAPYSNANPAWRELAQADPNLFVQIRRMDAEQRKQASEEIERSLELSSRAMSAVMGVAPEDRQAVYGELRPTLMEMGFGNLPEQWDENWATAQMRLGMTVREALSADTASRRLDADMVDDAIDNERADASAESLNTYRQGQLANARRGQDIASRDRRRGQDVASKDRRRGQDKARRGKGNEPMAMLNGRKIVVRNGAWVDAKTGAPVN